jgi:hypothetical protein
MLTLQQILDSDSISTLVAKLNANFQTLSGSNGGPQGIRGQQGIPGLPGRLGPTGVTGATGPTGNIVGIIPFAGIPSTGPTAIGPSIPIVAAYGTVGPWPQSAWQWLMYYESAGITGGGGNTAKHGSIYIDHANNGYWQYLTSPDVKGASGGGGYTQGGFYSYLGTGANYPFLGTTGGWAGSGWYYYPVPDPSANSAGVWITDTTTYLASNQTNVGGFSGPYAYGPIETDAASSLTVENARLLTKYGTLWITSGSDQNNPLSNEDSDLLTSTIGQWGHDPNQIGYPNPGRYNNGVDRLLFKMSLDGLPYLSNITARGFTGLSPNPSIPYPMLENSVYPNNTSGGLAPAGVQDLGYAYWTKPSYGVSLEKYTPLLFLSERKLDDQDPTLPFSSLGIYMFTDNAAAGLEDNQSKGLFLFSSRYSPDPTDMFDGFSGLDSAATENWGEMILDFRRVTASNHYVSSIPADLKLSSDYRSENLSGDYLYDENNVANTSGTNPGDIDAAYRTYQGYISAINGKTLTGDPTYANYWEYGLGDGTAGGPGGYTGGIHDAASGTAGMISRKTWYGSSVLDIKPEDWVGDTPSIESNNYIRVAGMMERGRRYLAAGVTSHFMSELIFYTSQFSANLGGAAGVTNDDIAPGLNDHRSLPSLYISPYRNIGIGTFVGGFNADNDQGPLEPAARLHIHVKENDRENDPTYTWQQVVTSGGVYDLLPNESFSVAAFSGDYGTLNLQYNTDILIGNLSAQGSEYVNPYDSIGNVVNPMQGATANYLRNAIRTESWKTRYINTLRFGAQPGVNYASVVYPIGKGKVEAFKNEFQIALHPITISSTLSNITDSNRSITAVGIHNLYPRTRTHIFGKNLYNETEFGEELWTPGYTIAGGSASGISGAYPYYGTTAQNSPSNNQIALDYIGDSYRYPVGIYDYQYFTYGANPGSTGVIGSSSPNSAVYPNREVLTPTRTNTAYGAELNNEAWPSTATNVILNGSYRHGGTANAWWEPTSYIGFNLFRDVSNADGHLDGDDRDNTRWILGTQGDNDYDHGNNGGAAIVSSPYGELGIVTIPRGRDGGHAYEQWEQRGLGTRDVLNNMKIVFDRNGNIAVGNAAGWDLDAYPSLDRFNTGLLRYTPDLNKDTAPGTTAGGGTGYTYGYWSGAAGQYGRVAYSGYTEDLTTSTAAKINALATEKEYIRLEVGAEKGWSRDGRLPEKRGYGYPPNEVINLANPGNYIKTTATVTGITQFQIVTDDEGRISDTTITFTGVGVGQSDFLAIVFPHPTEFNSGGPQAFPGFAAPAGALAMEWAGMNTDSQLYSATTLNFLTANDAQVLPTTDIKGSANVRLNNFVYGEGYGQTGGTAGTLIASKRQESPKLIFTFLEATPESVGSRGSAGTTPYKKVNTVVQSAQTESPLREYFIPKSDNTGGTFMVFTDHMGSKEKDSGFDSQLTSGTGFTGGRGTTGTTGGTGATGNVQKLQLLEVVTCELLRGYTGVGGLGIRGITGVTGNYTGLDTSSMGFARYFNTYYNQTDGTTAPTQYFGVGQYGTIVSYPAPTGFTAGNFSGPTGTTGATGSTGATGVSCVRNIDYYYKIFQGTTGNYDNGWNNDEFENKATDIRFKRINSEYALVDFNITIEVNNPVLPGGTGTGLGSANGTIDGFAPRMTQSVKMLYNMDLDVDADLVGNQDGWTEDKYGNGPWFSNWSSYRNWNTGAAQVGEDLSTDTSSGYLNPSSGKHYGVADSPYFITPGLAVGPPTWNGNFIDAGMFKASASLKNHNLYPTLGVGNTPFNRAINPIHGAFDNSVLNMTISENLFGDTGLAIGTIKPSYWFMSYLRSFYSVWGNQTMGRSRNMMWRITPFLAQNNVDPNIGAGSTWNRTNTFMIEIVFDTPIMHVSHEFEKTNFGTQNGSYYKYLTLSGQSIVRYGKTETTLTDA